MAGLGGGYIKGPCYSLASDSTPRPFPFDSRGGLERTYPRAYFPFGAFLCISIYTDAQERSEREIGSRIRPFQTPPRIEREGPWRRIRCQRIAWPLYIPSTETRHMTGRFTAATPETCSSERYLQKGNLVV